MGRVRVAAPKRTDEDTIRLAIVQRLPWIRRQREQLQNADRQTKREMESGETHYVWSQRYLLDVSCRSGHHSVKTRAEPYGSSPRLMLMQMPVAQRWSVGTAAN